MRGPVDRGHDHTTKGPGVRPRQAPTAACQGRRLDPLVGRRGTPALTSWSFVPIKAGRRWWWRAAARATIAGHPAGMTTELAREAPEDADLVASGEDVSTVSGELRRPGSVASSRSADGGGGPQYASGEATPPSPTRSGVTTPHAGDSRGRWLRRRKPEPFARPEPTRPGHLPGGWLCPGSSRGCRRLLLT